MAAKDLRLAVEGKAPMRFRDLASDEFSRSIQNKVEKDVQYGPKLLDEPAGIMVRVTNHVEEDGAGADEARTEIDERWAEGATVGDFLKEVVKWNYDDPLTENEDGSVGFTSTPDRYENDKEYKEIAHAVRIATAPYDTMVYENFDTTSIHGLDGEEEVPDFDSYDYTAYEVRVLGRDGVNALKSGASFDEVFSDPSKTYGADVAGLSKDWMEVEKAERTLRTLSPDLADFSVDRSKYPDPKTAVSGEMAARIVEDLKKNSGDNFDF